MLKTERSLCNAYNGRRHGIGVQGANGKRCSGTTAVDVMWQYTICFGEEKVSGCEHGKHRIMRSTFEQQKAHRFHDGLSV